MFLVDRGSAVFVLRKLITLYLLIELSFAGNSRRVKRQEAARSENLKRHIQILYAEVGPPEVPPRTTESEPVALNVTLRVERAELLRNGAQVNLGFVMVFVWPHQTLGMLPNVLDGLIVRPSQMWTPSVRVNNENTVLLEHETLQIRTGRKARFQYLRRQKNGIKCEQGTLHHPFSDVKCSLKITQEGASRKLPHIDFPQIKNKICPISSSTKQAVIMEYFLDYYPREDALKSQQKTLVIKICVSRAPLGPVLMRFYLPSCIALLLLAIVLFWLESTTQLFCNILLLLMQLFCWYSYSSNTTSSTTTALNAVDIWFATCSLMTAVGAFITVVPCGDRGSATQVTMHTSWNGSRLLVRNAASSYIADTLGPCDVIPPGNGSHTGSLDKHIRRCRSNEESNHRILGRSERLARLILVLVILVFAAVYTVGLIATAQQCPTVKQAEDKMGCVSDVKD